ncbi:peptidoglycan DD-metalloendopeptidase family protein [bacterium]|nr:peptidoglycan DD-metalloendopeptidase family protein [bacterium]
MEKPILSMRARLLVILFSVFSTVLFAATDPRDELDRLRGEIDSLTTVLKEQEASEQSLLSQIGTLDQKIAARRRLLNKLQAQLRGARKAVKRYDNDIGYTRHRLGIAERKLGQTNVEVELLEEQIRERAVYLYKHGTRSQLRFLAAAANPGDLLRRRVYVRRIQERDRGNLESLRRARARQDRQTEELEAAIADLREAREAKRRSAERVEELVAETEAERDELAGDRTEIATLLEDVRQDKDMVASLIREREEAMQEVENWIAKLERARLGGEVQQIRVHRGPGEAIVREVADFRTFTAGKGKLPWPVEGAILKRFGMERNPELGTRTENPGIDIAADEGDEIIAVQKGVCTRITYVRGFGTTMLIQHDDGFYTVYAHLGDVWVSEGEEIDAGRVLGTVGRVAHLPRPSLHFQVWHKRQKQDPLQWLRS